jgi:tetratricopeptide (TPR) repeat protein
LESEEQKKFRSILEASGVVSPFDEVRFNPPIDDTSRWQERIVNYRSLYAKPKPRFGGFFSRKYWKELSSHESVSANEQNLDEKPAEMYNSYCIRFWIRNGPNYKEAQKAAMIWNQKGNEFFHKGMYDNAIDCYDEAIRIEPYISLFWNNKGAALHDKGELEQGLNCYNIALKIDPNNTIALNGKAAVLYDLKQYNDALEYCDKAIGINPYLSSAWYNKALALDKLGRKKEVSACIQKIVDLEK